MVWFGIDLQWAYSDLLPNIYRQTYCKHHARDILHDALVRFALTTSPGRVEQPHAYLRIIVRNLLIDSHREAARLVPLPSDDDTIEKRYDSARFGQPTMPSAEHLADIQQRLHIMQSLINRLPPRCKEVFWLYRIEGLPQQDIADRFGISLNMVQRHIIRAMVDLLEARELIR
jgi:RNA polymerase sigma factor (sigma-70 family)